MDFASAGANIISSAINAATQNKNTKRMIAAQKEENEKAYQRNLEMWEKENAYNTPYAVMQRLREAGMNPNLAYGTPNVSAPSPDAPITDMSSMANLKSPVGAALEESVNARYMNAMIQNINADTKDKEAAAKKTNAEGDYQLTYNQYAEQIITGNIKELNSRIELNASQTDLNDMKSRESYTNIQNIIASTNVMRKNLQKLESEIANIDEDIAIKRIEKEMRRDVLKAQMSHLYAQARLAQMTAAKTQEEFNQLSAAAIYNLVNKKEGANNAMLQGMVLQNTADEIQLKVDAAHFKNRKMREHEWLDDVNKVAGTFSNVIGSVTDAFTFGYRNAYVWK